MKEKLKAIRTGTVTGSVTVTAGSYAEKRIELPTDAVGIIGVNIYGTGSALACLYGFMKDGSDVLLKIGHRGSGTGSATFSLTVYYLAL